MRFPSHTHTHTHTHTRFAWAGVGRVCWYDHPGVCAIWQTSSNTLTLQDQSKLRTCFSVFPFFCSTPITFHQQGASFRKRLRDRKIDEGVLRERQGTRPNSDDANKRDLGSGVSVKHPYTHTHSELNLTHSQNPVSFGRSLWRLSSIWRPIKLEGCDTLTAQFTRTYPYGQCSRDQHFLWPSMAAVGGAVVN